MGGEVRESGVGRRGFLEPENRPAPPPSPSSASPTWKPWGASLTPAPPSPRGQGAGGGESNQGLTERRRGAGGASPGGVLAAGSSRLGAKYPGGAQQRVRKTERTFVHSWCDGGGRGRADREAWGPGTLGNRRGGPGAGPVLSLAGLLVCCPGRGRRVRTAAECVRGRSVWRRDPTPRPPRAALLSSFRAGSPRVVWEPLGHLRDCPQAGSSPLGRGCWNISRGGPTRPRGTSAPSGNNVSFGDMPPNLGA